MTESTRSIWSTRGMYKEYKEDMDYTEYIECIVYKEYLDYME